MSIKTRDSVALRSGYHSPQVPAAIRLNTNESPYPPPAAWYEEVRAGLNAISFNRYPDRHAWELREALAGLHGVSPEEIFCANGSNEVLQSLMLAYGGPGRQALTFEPTYALHSHISQLVGTEVIQADREPDFSIDPKQFDSLAERDPEVVFFCSPNNPTANSDPPELAAAALESFSGLVVVDEAYGSFSPHSAIPLRRSENGDRLVVVRTFSKAMAMAGMRLGYAIADPEVVSAMEAACLPYHLDAFKQMAGIVAVRQHRLEEPSFAELIAERSRIQAGIAAVGLGYWQSDANFVLFSSGPMSADALWQGLLNRSVLVRNCSSWPGLEGCLRVTVGTPAENDGFLAALSGAFGELS